MIVRDFVNSGRRRLLYVLALSFFVCSTGIVSGCRTTPPNDFHSEALALIEHGKYSDVIALCEQELKARPNDPDLFAYRGAGLLRSGKGDLAKVDLLKAISLDGKVGWYYRELGSVYSDQGNFREAIAAFDNSLRLDSSAHNASIAFAVSAITRHPHSSPGLARCSGRAGDTGQ